MTALEFNTTLTQNAAIKIPLKIQQQLKAASSKKIRVIVLIDETEVNEEKEFKQISKKVFLNGYAASDSIYDNL
ncbi:MAG: hypothetical protein RL708_1241 [Bacteroidota bacterium]|jgi:histidyl-tRNA synthetase